MLYHPHKIALDFWVTVHQVHTLKMHDDLLGLHLAHQMEHSQILWIYVKFSQLVKRKKKPKFRRRQDQYSGNSGHVEQSLVTEGLLEQHDGISWVYVAVLWLAAVKCSD